MLSRVLDAAVVSDGTVLVADGSTAQQPAKLWSVGPDGRVASPREPFGEGREGFGALWRLFAVGDTVLAYDIGRSAVASWLPGAEEPEFRGVPGELIVMAALSSRLWIVVQYQPDQQAERLSSSALQRRWRSIFIVSADLARRSLVGQRDIGYEYHLSEPTQYAVYRADFLGGAQFASANGKWVFAPIDDEELEVWSQAGDLTRTIALPGSRSPYVPDIGWETKEKWTRASPHRAGPIRDMFAHIWRDLPPLAPLASRAVGMGSDVWILPFGSGADTGRNWIVVDPIAGATRATVTVDSDMKLLGGSADVAVLLGRTESGEEFVQVREIVRSVVP